MPPEMGSQFQEQFLQNKNCQISDFIPGILGPRCVWRNLWRWTLSPIAISLRVEGASGVELAVAAGPRAGSGLTAPRFPQVDGCFLRDLVIMIV